MSRTILFLLLVASAGCNRPAGSGPAPTPAGNGSEARPYEDPEDKALRHVEQLGGTVTRKKSAEPGDPPITVDLSGKAVTDADLKEFAGFRNVTRLDLSGTQVSGAGLKELARVYSLGSLDLSRCPNVNDTAMKELGKFESLTQLDISGTPVSDAGLKELESMPAIDSLDVSDTKVTDGGIAEFRKMRPRCKVKK